MTDLPGASRDNHIPSDSLFRGMKGFKDSGRTFLDREDKGGDAIS
jgi:hypothetical protein